MKPICIPCQRFYRCKQTGYSFIEGMPSDNGVPPGKECADLWKPYKLWKGDLYECPTCGHQTIAGVGFRPIAEHYQDGFAEAVVIMGATFQVNDC